MSEKLTKSALLKELAEKAGINKKQAADLLDALVATATEALSKKGPGEITIPGLIKLKAKKTAATKERQGVNPFTKEPKTFPAKPAGVKVKATLVKAFKDAVAPKSAK